MNGISMTSLDDSVVNRGGEGTDFPEVDFNCLKGQYPLALKGVDIF